MFISLTPTGVPTAPTLCGARGVSTAPTPSEAQRRLIIDGRIFKIPANSIEAFLATRVMTLAAYKRIAPLTAGGNREWGIPERRDIAFLSRTATLGIEEDTDLMQDDEVPDSQDSSTMRSTESPPPAGNVGTEASEVEDEDDEDYRPSYSVRRRLTQNTILTPATDSATITTTSTKTTVLARAIDSAATSITSTTTPIPRAPFSPQVAFLGDFENLAHAQHELGKRAVWVKAKYVDGLYPFAGGMRSRRKRWGKAGVRIAETPNTIGCVRCKLGRIRGWIARGAATAC